MSRYSGLPRADVVIDRRHRQKPPPAWLSLALLVGCLIATLVILSFVRSNQ